MRQDERRHPAIVFLDVCLGEAAGGVENLFQVRQGESSPPQFDDLPGHRFFFISAMIFSNAATRSGGPSPSASAASGASTIAPFFSLRSSRTFSRRSSA